MKKLLLALFLVLPLVSNAQTDSIGVYYEIDSSLNKIEPMVHSNQKTSVKVFNLKKNRVYNGAISDNVVSSEPVFYFYYPQDISRSDIREYNTFYATAPEDVTVVELKQKMKKRELYTEKIQPLFYAARETNVRLTSPVNLITDKVKEGVYRVSFDKPLKDGEYAFVFKQLDGPGIGGFIFDFSVGGKNLKIEKDKNMKKNKTDMYF